MTSIRGAGSGNPLADAVWALERGDWRAAVPLVFDGGPVSGAPEVDLIVGLRCVTRAMRLQRTRGDLQAAWNQLDTARVALDHDGAHHGLHLTRSVLRLVDREASDLLELRRIVTDLPRGRAELAYACVEWLTWAEFDPWTVRRHRNERRLLLLEGDDYDRFHIANRRDMCERATRLRHFVGDRGGSVTEAVWRRIGGYAGLRDEALRVLAGESLTRGRKGGPVRLGRLRAWEYAQGLDGDVAT